MQQNLTIYFTSDVHGCYTAAEDGTGLANCMSGFKRGENTLIIDGGDTLQGSPLTYYLYSQRRSGECVPAKLMNIGGYDFITLGNHDFDYGKAEIERYLAQLDAVCLCANISGIAGVEKTAMVTLENGLHVGLTGVTTQFVTRWQNSETMRGITVGDAFEAAREALDELKATGAELTVCIYHGGFENDVNTGAVMSDTGENQGWRICNELDYDILLTGHQHMAAENLCIGGTYTCQPPDKGQAYIRMDVAVDAGRVTAVSKLCTPSGTAYSAAAEYLAPIERENVSWLDSVLGRLDTPLAAKEPLYMAEHGSYIANFFNQVQLEASGADISMTSLDGAVKGFAQEVTVRDVVSSYVFKNTLKTLRINGAQLKRALERSAEYFAPDDEGKIRVSDSFLKPIVQHFNFDYVSGLNVTVDVRRPVGERVVEMLYKGEPLSPESELTVCLNSYRASGAGGYGVYNECACVGEVKTEVAELIIDYISRHKNVIVDKTKWLSVIY